MEAREGIHSQLRDLGQLTSQLNTWGNGGQRGHSSMAERTGAMLAIKSTYSQLSALGYGGQGGYSFTTELIGVVEAREGTHSQWRKLGQCRP